MPRTAHRSRIRRYLIAFVAPLVVALIMQLTWPLFEHSPVALFLIAVVFTAWYGGLLPSVLSVLFSWALSNFFFVRPFFSFARPGSNDLVSLLSLLVIGMIISVIVELLHRRRELLEGRLTSKTLADLTTSQLAAIVESSSDSIISKDLEGRVNTWNLGAAAMFGYSAEEMIGQPLMNLIPMERRDEEVNIMTRIKNGERVERLETERIRKDGKLIEVEITVSPILNSEGTIVGASNVTRDITARRKAEVARHASDARYQTLFEYAPDGILIADAQRYYLDANSSICRMLGYTREELIGLHGSDIVAPAENGHIEKALEEIYREGHYRDWILKRKDGSTFQAEVMAIAMPDGNVLTVIRDITERRRAELALRESEEQLRLAVTATKIGTWQLDLQTWIRKWSDRSKELFGLPTTVELTDEVIMPLIYEEDKSRLDDILRRSLEPSGSGQLHIEFRVHVANEAEPRWIESQGHVLYEHGQPRRVIGTMIDVTDRKRAELALEAEQKLLRTLIDMLPDYIYLKDTQSRFLACNNACARLMGQISQGDLIGKTDGDFYPQNLAEQFRADELKVLAGKPLVNKEEVFTRPDGEHELLLTTKLPIYDSEGKVTGLVGYGRSISAARAAEEARQTMKARLEFALQTSQIGAWELSLTNKRINKTLITDQIFGYQEHQADWSYETFLAHVVPEDREQINLGFDTTSKAMWNFECRIRRADGAIRWIWAAGGHELNAEGEPISLSGIVQDITSRKEAEAEIRKLNDELEERVQHRTAQLEAAVKELEAFSYSVSHDLRAPLRHINGFSQALIEDCGEQLDEQGKGYLREVRGASIQMAQLIDDVLDLARVSRSKMHREQVNLTELAHSVFSELRKTDDERRVAIDIDDGMIAMGDKRLLRIVLTNLLGNAWKFTSKKQDAKITFGHTMNDGETVYFVRDNGAGFDMQYVDKLFGTFQRLHTSTEFEGTGIGLATINRIVQRHGGKVWAEGLVNEGATFWFTLA